MHVFFKTPFVNGRSQPRFSFAIIVFNIRQEIESLDFGFAQYAPDKTPERNETILVLITVRQTGYNFRHLSFQQWTSEFAKKHQEMNTRAGDLHAYWSSLVLRVHRFQPVTQNGFEAPTQIGDFLIGFRRYFGRASKPFLTLFHGIQKIFL